MAVATRDSGRARVRAVGYPQLLALAGERTARLPRGPLVLVDVTERSRALAHVAAAAAAHGDRRTLLVTAGATSACLAHAVLGSLARLEPDRLRQHRLESDDWPRLSRATRALHGAQLWLAVHPAFDPAWLVATACSAAHQRGFGLVALVHWGHDAPGVEGAALQRVADAVGAGAVVV